MGINCICGQVVIVIVIVIIIIIIILDILSRGELTALPSLWRNVRI